MKAEIITAADFEAACEVDVYEGPVAEMLLGSFFEELLIASDRAINAAKNNGTYDTGRERFALHQELRSAL